MNRIVLILLFILTCLLAYGQDSVANLNDSTSVIVDTMQNASVAELNPEVDAEQHLGEKRSGQSKGLYFFIGLGTFLLFGLLRFVYARHIKELFDILTRSTLGRMTSKESIWQNLMPRWLFLAVYFLSGGYVLGQLIKYMGAINESPSIFWFWGVSILFLAYLFKFLTVHAVALVFRFNKIATSFFNHLSVVNQLLGMILLPICGILLLAPTQLTNILLIIAGLMLFISLIFKLLINVAYVRNLSRVNYFHFILYLCTLEFIPLAVFARYLYSGIGV